MYESPISKIMGEIQQQIIRDDENHLLYQVEQSVGYFVDKEELIKALNYDREQYQKGYHDGSDANKWIPVSERLPEEEHGEYFITWTTSMSKRPLIAICEGEVTSEYGFEWILDSYIKCYPNVKVIAWMPLPEPYKAESDG